MISLTNISKEYKHNMDVSIKFPNSGLASLTGENGQEDVGWLSVSFWAISFFVKL